MTNTNREILTKIKKYIQNDPLSITNIFKTVKIRNQDNKIWKPGV